MLDVTAGQSPSDSAHDRLSSVFAAYQDRIHALIYRNIRRPDWHLAEDLTSETFVRVVRDLPRTFVDDEHMWGWLATIAKHVVVDHYRRARNSREHATDFSDTSQARRLPTAAAAEDVAVDRMSARAELHARSLASLGAAA